MADPIDTPQRCALLPAPPEAGLSVDEIVNVGRATRKHPSRALWIAALILGGACAIAFVVMLFVDTGAPSHEPPPSRASGFSGGLLVGLAVGVVIGVAIARQRRASHSSDKTP